MNQQVSKVNNPFSDNLPKTNTTAMADSEGQRSIAEVQSAMVIAKRFPRNQMEAMDRIVQACTRPTLANGALYSYSKGGAEVTGPSIRLAEALAQSWGNLQFGIRELEQRNGESVVEAFAWDVETNTRQVKIFTVPHMRYSKAKGNTPLNDPREIYEHVANNGARRLRACILGVIPGDVIETAVKQCETTLRASVDISPEGLKKMLAVFSKFDVTKAMIEKRIQCRIEAIRPAQFVQMQNIYSSLKDGMSAPEDWFDIQDNSMEPETVTAKKSPPKAPANTKPAKNEAEQEPQEEPGEVLINEKQQKLITSQAENAGKTVEDLCKAFEVAEINALRVKDLDGVFDWINE